MSSDGTKMDLSQFDWVQLKAELDASHKKTTEETFVEKFNRKFNENPLVPVGCLLTAGALTYGLISFRKGDSKTSQTMMRVRIGAQGFTIMALLGGIVSAAMKAQSTPQ